LVLEKKASNLHLDPGSAPILRVNEVLLPQEDIPPFTRQDILSVLEHVTTTEQKEEFQREMELEFAHSFFS
jgi:twitching motility protein PilT